MSSQASESAMSGADTEAGSEYRAGVGAVLAAHALRGWGIEELELGSPAPCPVSISLETDDPVDDIACELDSGGKMLIQAKRTLKLSVRPKSPFGKAFAQCRSAIEEGGLSAESDRLVIVSGEVSGPVRDLKSALWRRRQPISGSFSPAEMRALNRIKPLTHGMSENQIDSLLDILVIWICDAEELTGTDAKLACVLLDGAIVPHGSGKLAYSTLLEFARKLARGRLGSDIGGLLKALRSAHVDLVDDLEGAKAARLVARQRAATQYRGRVQRAGQTISLLGVGAGLPDLELSDIDADVSAVEPSLDEEKMSERRLEVLIRRRGRLTLTGLPGSGKSTALRIAAAEQAANPDAPLPILVKLETLAERLEDGNFLGSILDLVTEDQSGQGKSLLREQIANSISRGRATILFDGLDEAKSKKRGVVEALSNFLKKQDRSLEIVLATRDSAYIDAKALGFREARLVAPSNVESTTKAILRAFANSKVSVIDVKSWVDIRQRWIEKVLERDPDLKETPLMPILLSVSVAFHEDHTDLPQLRARILEGIVSDVVRQWEMTRSSGLRLGAIEGAAASEALLTSFSIEGSAILSAPSPDAKTVTEGIAAYFEHSWGLAPASARATAVEAIQFWDETGFFILEKTGGVTSRVRLFAEMADGLSVTRMSDEEIEAWVSSALEADDKSEALKLAAGISEAAADEIFRGSIEFGDQGRVFNACEALLEGAEIRSERLDGLVKALLALVANGGEVSIEAASNLSKIAVPVKFQVMAREAFKKHLPEGHDLVAQVNATFGWKKDFDDADFEQFREILRSESPKHPEEDDAEVDGITALRFWGPDLRWARAIGKSAEVLIPRSKEDAVKAAEIAGQLTMALSNRVTKALRIAGYDDLVKQEQIKRNEALKGAKDWQKGFQELHDAQIVILKTISDLAHPKPLSQREARGLDQLVDLYFTAGFNDAPAWEPANLGLKNPEKMKDYIRACAELGDFELDLLAAEASSLLEEVEVGDGRAWESILFVPGTQRPLKCWTRVDSKPKRVEQLVSLLVSPRFSAWRTAEALSAAPQELGVHAKVISIVSKPAGWWQKLCGILALQTAPERAAALILAREWLEGDEVPLRRAASCYAALLLTEPGSSNELAIKALEDPDLEVRDEVLTRLETSDVTPDIADLIENCLTGGEGWECGSCGHHNDPDRTSCENCNIVGPELKKHANDLLQG